MTRLCATLTLIFFVSVSLHAQSGTDVDLNSEKLVFDPQRQVWTFSEGGTVRWNGIVLTADRGTLSQQTGDTLAEGSVRIQRGEQLWTGDSIRFNFITGEMVSDEYRTGVPPVFAGGRGLHGYITNTARGGASNMSLFATNAFITTDDFSEPAYRIRARRVRIVPEQKIEAWHATVLIGEVPVFYYPYFVRNLGERANNFSFTPGYRSRHGAFVLGTYTWFLNQYIDGEIHADYRAKRGPGGGPDVNFDFGRWGEGTIRYYYIDDDEPATNRLFAPVRSDRQRIYFSYQATPYTNFQIRALARYQTDPGIIRDFFEGEYRDNPQPNSFLELNRFWDNLSIDVLAQPRVNRFYETVERLPDVRISAFRQQIGASPFYYESESSAGYYRRLFGPTNFAQGLSGLFDTNDFSAPRADTYHQVTMPWTLFGWLNIVPRVGGRFTYYGETKGARDSGGPGTRATIHEETSRLVFNTGAEATFKASRVWPGVENRFLQLNGLRHIIQPSANYVYVPRPDERPGELPQFDYELASLRMLPLEYPMYNAIDSIDSENVLRLGLRNKLQTKRAGEIDDWFDWEVFTDWRLKRRTNQSTFGDLFSDIVFRPRSWITVQSQTRYSISDDEFRMSLQTVTLQPNDVWSLSVGYFYLRSDRRDDPTAWGEGNSLVTSSVFYRMNENWGFRATHHYNARDSRLQEQFYTMYRDLRSWTAALSLGLRDDGEGPKDYMIAFTFSLKARPRFALGADSVRPYQLLNGY